MDNFGIDLDKVLDDFELSEDGPSTAMTESKHNHSNRPILQPPVSIGNVYNVPQVIPLPTVYTANSETNSTYRQHSQYPNEYDPQSLPGDITSPPKLPNSIINLTVDTDGSGDVNSTSKPNTIGEIDRTLLTTNAQHDNHQWTGINNNPLAHVYQYQTGVLAHGERSNGNALHRLGGHDIPEFFQSTQDKPTDLESYPGEVVTPHARPDVVPVSLNNIVDTSLRRPNVPLQLQNNILGNAYNFQNDTNLSGHEPPLTAINNSGIREPFSQNTVMQDVPQQPLPNQGDKEKHLTLNQPATSLQGILPQLVDQQQLPPVPNQELVHQGNLQQDTVEQEISRQDLSFSLQQITKPENPSDLPDLSSDHACSKSNSLQSFAHTESEAVKAETISDNGEDHLNKPKFEPDTVTSCQPDSFETKFSQNNIENKASTASISKECISSVTLQKTEDVTVGFGDVDDDEMTADDMDTYMATFESTDSSAVDKATTSTQNITTPPGPLKFVKNFESVRLDQQIGAVKSCEPANYSNIQTNHGNVEKFLAAAITSPRIATPMEDPGFSKVPGYLPSSGISAAQKVETVLEEENENEDSCIADIDVGETCDSSAKVSAMVAAASHGISEQVNNVPQIETSCVMTKEKINAQKPLSLGLGGITVSLPDRAGSETFDPVNILAGSGARPKENSIQRKSRPNSLLGLSKPDLNITMTVSNDAVAQSDTNSAVRKDNTNIVENTHDIINRQLAQIARSPLQKKQLNLEIKQHLDQAAAARQMETNSSEGLQISRSALIPNLAGVNVVTNRAQLASGVGLNLPTGGNSLLPQDSGLTKAEDAISTSSSSSLISNQQTPSPARAAYQPNIEHIEAANSDQLRIQQPERELGADGECDENGASKLKRPTSLSLMPRHDFQVAGEKDSTDDDSVIGIGGCASGGSSAGHLTPFMPENEAIEQAGAMPNSGADMMYSPPEVGPGAFSPTLRCSSNSNMAVSQLGRVAPRWVPDAEACNCMQCDARFTFTKRRHHCRACGKVFCSACCNLKCKLQCMDNKEVRVCSKCYQDIVRAQAYERMHSPNRSPNPNNPAEYCSTIPPLQQAASSLHAPPPVIMVPVGVLRKEGSHRSREPKQVMFSDGIRPGGDLTELDGSDARLPLRRHSRSSKKVERLAAAAAATASAPSEATTQATKSPSPKLRVKRLPEPAVRPACLIPETGLPPVIMSTGVKGDFTLEEDPNPESTMPKIRSVEDPNPVVFAINKNLFVLVKIVNLDCCLNRVCWCFSTKGMCTVGQDEVVLVLECLPDEKTVPRDIFCHLNSVYDEASKGNTVSHLGHTIFGQSFLGSRDHCGFLYVRPTFQCVQKLLLPQPPYVFGLLLQKWETPWAKVFPIRLMLRLGAEYRYYPCPLISVRYRKPVYGEIGHTIMNLLADFRNYQYMLPQMKGVVIHMEEKKTFIKFPRNRYEEVMKVITNSNDHVMALGANFSTDADSHLVCIQNEDGNYQTQAINIQNKPRKVTGASFVVFNGALKTSSGLRAKSSIVEDGLMVQITSEAMGQLKAALLDMKDFTINCGSLEQPTADEQVIVQWVEDDHKVNQGVKSPIDGLPMDGIESIHIHNGTDYVGESRTIRWTEVFFIQNEDSSKSRGEPVDLSRLAETLAGACCIALTPQLDKLKESGLTKLGLRCTIDRDRVGYEVGANSDRLPDEYMNDLDNELIPVIHNAGSHSQDGPVVLELIFYIIE